MNSFDASILCWLNGFARRSYTFDVAVTELATSNLAKGVPLVTLLLVFWFASRDVRRRREVVLATVAASAAALFAGRFLAHALPFRDRPIHAAGFEFVAPHGPASLLLRDWSAFPSDHAMLFFALATGIAFLSRRLGAAALLWVAAFVALPRVYLGWHHPTDVIAGGLVGAACAALANAPAVRGAIAAWPLRWLERHPPSFYAAAFVVAAQIATMFGDVRNAAHGVVEAWRGRPEAVATTPTATPTATPTLTPTLTPTATTTPAPIPAVLR